MTRRFASLWLPTWPTDRWRRNKPTSAPLALVAAGQGGVRLVALDAVAAAEGLTPGMTLADARALVPDLVAGDADPVGDAKALDAIVLWCSRYTPWAAMDGADGVILEITGCAHLFGGETAMLKDMVRRLAQAGIAAQGGIADTPAAWAWGRFRPPSASAVLSTADAAARLGALPVAGLRLPPDITAHLTRVGLRTIDSLRNTPRAPLGARYGAIVAQRLDQLAGASPQPIAPRAMPRTFTVRAGFVEPISRREDFEPAAERLLVGLCARLSGAGRGARRLELTFFRVDASAQRISIGTSRPSRDPRHLLKLFTDKFESIDAGFGIEAMALAATAVDRFEGAQSRLGEPGESVDVEQLIDRLRSRGGAHAVTELVPSDTHIPEGASATAPALQRRGRAMWSVDDAPRPVMLLERPEPIDVEPLIDRGPPFRFRWRGVRHQVGLLEGPERIKAEWWRAPEAAEAWRDYYRIETVDGRRLWIFCAEDTQRWYVHGLFP